MLAKTADTSALDPGLEIVINDPVNLAYIGSNSVSNVTQAQSVNGTGSLNAKSVNIKARLSARTDVQGYLLTNGNGNNLNGLVVMALDNAEK